MKILTHEGLQHFYNQIAAKFSTKEQTAEAIEEAVSNAGIGTVTSVNGKTGVVQLSASDVGALPASTQIPSIAGLATETYVNNKVTAMVDSAPETLNTLNELAAALGDDPNFATTVATEIGGKVSKSGDTMTGQLTASGLSIKSDGWAMLRFYNAEGVETGGFYSNQDARQLNFFSKDKSGYNDYFKLPYPSGLTADGYYDILTSKNPVTIAQGGTGATNRKDAWNAICSLGDQPITSPENDTTSNWAALGNGKAWYFTDGMLNNQPSGYGILLNYVNGSDVFQIWNCQNAGPTYLRCGNAGGWAGTGWRKVFDSANYPNGIKYGNVGLDVSIASTPIITARNNDIANWALERHDANDELTVHFYNNNGTWTSLGRVLATNNFTTYVTPAAIGALPISGGTLTGSLTMGDGTLFTTGHMHIGSNTGPYLYTGGTNFVVRYGDSSNYHYANFTAGGPIEVDGNAVSMPGHTHIGSEILGQVASAATAAVIASEDMKVSLSALDGHTGILAHKSDKADFLLYHWDEVDIPALAVHYYNSDGEWIANNVLLNHQNFYNWVTPAAIGAVSKAGDTMTGNLLIDRTSTAESASLTVANAKANISLITMADGIHGIWDNNKNAMALWAGTDNNWHLVGTANYADNAGSSNWLAHHSSSDFAPTFGANGLQYFNASLPNSGTASTSYAPTTDWWHILRMNHFNASGYYVDIGTCFHEDRIALRRVVSGNDAGWVDILTEKGGSITGDLSVSGTITANKVVGAVYA